MGVRNHDDGREASGGGASQLRSNLIRNIDDARRNQVDFLKVELDTSLAFLDRAATTLTPETRERNLQNARIGYDTIRRALDQGHLEGEDAEKLMEGLRALEEKLKKAGAVF